MTDQPKTDPTKGGGSSTRRGLLGWIWAALGLALTAELGWIGFSFLRPRRRAGDAASEGIVTAGPMDDFERESVTAFPAGSFYLVRLSDGGFLALHRECTHLGCTVPWVTDAGQFACPCHASVFDITGQVLSPPAPRPLDLLQVRIENGIVKVNTARRIRRSTYRSSQAVHL